MMAVVVVDRDPRASPRSSKRRPAPVNSGSTRSAASRDDAGELERRQRGGGVSPVVLAGNSELQRRRLQLLASYRLGRLREPALEQLAHLGLGANVAW